MPSQKLAPRGSRVAILAALATVLALPSAPASAQPRVAIVAAAGTNPTTNFFVDPQTKLLGTGLFSAVDIISVTRPSPIPSLLTLSTYDAVMVWSNEDFTSASDMGDVLADYTDWGGGVVATVFVVNSNTEDRFLTGRWLAGGYPILRAPAPPTSGTTTSTSNVGAIHIPMHPIMQGVVTIDSNNSGRPSAAVTFAPHAIAVADWADGRPLVRTSSQFPTRVDLGLYPPSSDVSTVLWDQTTDGATLMANALLYAAAAGDALTTPPFGSGQASTSPVFAGSSVLLTVTALPGANPASTGIAVAANLAAFGGSASQAFTPAGGNVFTHNLNIPAFQGAGSYSIPLTVTDAQARTGGGSIKLLVLPAPPAGFIVEAEPNDTPAQSTPAMLASGQGVVGHTTGASLTIPGSPSVDYFLISTAAAPPGIYRHRMAITSSGAAGHTGTLRGLTQTSGTINPGTDATFQTSLATTSPPRMNQWYGFGRSEQIRYRVAGSTTTSLEYIATLETVPVTPVDFPGDLPVGEITITRGTGTTATVDMLVYDAGFQPFMDFNNDGGNTLTRTFARGAYYLAVSNSNTADTRPSGLDSSSRSGNVLEFPGAVANSTTTLVATLTMLFTGGGGSTSQEVFVSKDNPFDVVWIKFRVGPPCDADFNGSGAVTVQDIFDFLGAYFTNNPAADINHSGSVTVQDIFDFLGTYFAGC